MSDEENVTDPLAFIEATNALADAMDAMKCALEARNWSTPVAEHVGAQFGGVLFAMMQDAQRPSKPSRASDG